MPPQSSLKCSHRSSRVSSICGVPAGTGIAAIVYNYDGDCTLPTRAAMLAEMGDKTFKESGMSIRIPTKILSFGRAVRSD